MIPDLKPEPIRKPLLLPPECRSLGTVEAGGGAGGFPRPNLFPATYWFYDEKEEYTAGG